MRNIEVLRERWTWHRENRSIWLWGFAASGVTLGAILYQPFGLLGLAVGFLPFLLTCAIVGPMYGWIDRKMRALRKSVAGEEGDVAEGLAHIGRLQGPAILIMKETELVLVLLTGRRLTVPLGEIQAVRESWNMYGKGFLWKRAFVIEAPQNQRIGFAVAPSVADRWRERFGAARLRHV